MKLAEEVENAPDDDDNLFSDPKPRRSQIGQFTNYQSFDWFYCINLNELLGDRAREAQVSEGITYITWTLFC